MEDNRGLSSEKLAEVAARAAQYPYLLAHVLALYASKRRLGDNELCFYFSCDVDTLNRLRLCTRPDPDPAAFAIDVRRIATHFGLDAGKLARVIREVDTVSAFDQRGKGSLRPFSSTPGMLKAARDHNGDELSGLAEPPAVYSTEEGADGGTEEQDNGNEEEVHGDGGSAV